MRHFSKLAVMALACSLWSCSDDAPVSDTGKQGGENDFYAKITLKLPTEGGSRSQTKDPTTGNEPAESTDGYEYGKDRENNVSSVTVILATRAGSEGAYTYTPLTSANGVPLQDKAATSPTFVMQFDAAKVKEAVTKNETLYMFAYCNHTPGTVSSFHEKGSIVNGGTPSTPISIAQPDNFLMTNAQIAQANAIGNWDSMVGTNTSSNPFNLGTVSVERVACRFDFKETKTEGMADNTYPIYEQPAYDGTPATGHYGNIELQVMALFNEAKDFYYLRHISPTGTTTNWNICTKETPDNFVVGPNWDAFSRYNTACLGDPEYALPATTEALFHYPIATVVKQANENNLWTALNSLKEDDNHNSTTNTPSWDPDTKDENKDYHIWRYATENTIPGPGAQPQRFGISTGIVFRGELTSVDGDGLASTLKNAMKAKEDLYAYRESTKESNKSNLTTIFGSAMDLYNYCKSHAGTDPRKNFVKAVWAGVFTVTATPAISITTTTKPSEDQITELDNKLFGEGVTVSAVAKVDTKTNADLKPYKFICYAPTIGTDGVAHYYSYYYYANRHNYNGTEMEMGPMEFATVRNNIYKLKVDMVSALGLPEDTPPDPWTPDENPQVYFKVSVKVLDWVVRKNSIKF